MKPIKNLAQHLNGLPLEQWGTFAKSLVGNPKSVGTLLGHPYPKSTKYMRKGRRPGLSTIQQELLWAATLCAQHAESIDCFLKCRLKFDAAILSSDHELALTILDDVESKFGVSSWLIESRFGTLAEMVNESKAADYFQKLSAAQVTTPLIINLLVGFSWLRSGLAVTNASYVDLVETVAKEVAKKAPLDIEYFKFKVAVWSFSIDHFSDLASILNSEANSPIIDRYLTLVRVSSFLVARDCNEFAPLVSQALGILDAVKDYEKNKILDFLTCSTQYFGPVPSSFNNYSRGEHDAAAFDLATTLVEEPTITANHLIYSEVKAASTSHDTAVPESATLKKKICYDFECFIARTPKYSIALEQLHRTLRRFSMSSWSTAVAARIKAEETLEVPWTLPNSHARLYSMLLPASDHLKLRYCPDIIFADAEKHVDQLTPFYQMEVYMRQGRPLDEQMVSSTILDKAYREYRKAWWAMCSGQVEAAQRIFQELVDDDNGNIRIKSRIFLLQLTAEANPIEFVNGAVQYYLDNPAALQNVDLTSFIKGYKDSDLFDSLQCLPNLPILLHIYDQIVGLERKREIADAIDDLILFYDVRTPLDIPQEAFASKKARIFFIAKVCVSDNREGSIVLPTQDDVFLERIKICEELTKLDLENEKVHRQEGVNLRELLQVRKLLATYNGAKIYVDEENIRRLFEAAGKEQFITIKQQSRLVPEKLELYDRDAKTPSVQLGGNLDYYLLLKPYATFRDLFCSEKRYGLNTSLSVFIRHGIIDGKLKASMAKYGLTVRSHREAFARLFKDVASIDILGPCIRRFSLQVDAAVKELKSTYLQMKSKSNPSGLLDFSVETESVITNQHLVLLSKNISSKTIFDDFCTILFNQFWERTDDGLKQIRRYLTENFKKKIIACFDELVADVTKNALELLPVVRTQVITSKQEWNRDLDEIVSWFKRGKPYEYEEFLISRVVQASQEHTRSLYPDVNINGNIAIHSTSRFRGRCFSPLLTMFNIIFENVVTYSRSSAPSYSLRVWEEQQQLKIVLNNNVSTLPSAELEECERHLQEVLDSLESSDFYELVDIEGRSGLRKIKKLITSDLNCTVEVSASYSSEKEFQMELQIEMTEVLA